MRTIKTQHIPSHVHRPMRHDFSTIAGWIRPNSHVLDLGCGDGTLLQLLLREKHVCGYGIEIDPSHVSMCAGKGVNVIQADIEDGLHFFEPGQFDYVVMTQTLQSMHAPKQVLRDMRKIGRECIVTFPNFGHWRVRMHLLLQGTMPMSRTLPHVWFDTPNIHLCTVRDFETLCEKEGIGIVHSAYLRGSGTPHAISRRYANLYSESALYHLRA